MKKILYGLGVLLSGAIVVEVVCWVYQMNFFLLHWSFSADSNAFGSSGTDLQAVSVLATFIVVIVALCFVGDLFPDSTPDDSEE